MEKKIRYKSSGFVLGNYWGGGQGGYPARKYEADTLEELIALNEKALADGSLDSGMGYEKLLGAAIEVCTITTVEVDGKEYTNNEYHDVLIGDLTEEQQEWLLECLYLS